MLASVLMWVPCVWVRSVSRVLLFVFWVWDAFECIVSLLLLLCASLGAVNEEWRGLAGEDCALFFTSLGVTHSHHK